MLNLIEQSPQNTKDHVAAKIVKSKLKTEESNNGKHDLTTLKKVALSSTSDRPISILVVESKQNVTVQKPVGRNRMVDNFFSTIELEFEKSNNDFKRHLTYCNNVASFLEIVFSQRQYDISETPVKVGIEGGGGFLKVCLSFYNITLSSSPTLRNNNNNKYSDSGVKKLFIIRIVDDVPENYKNVAKI